MPRIVLTSLIALAIAIGLTFTAGGDALSLPISEGSVPLVNTKSVPQKLHTPVQLLKITSDPADATGSDAPFTDVKLYVSVPGQVSAGCLSEYAFEVVENGVPQLVTEFVCEAETLGGGGMIDLVVVCDMSFYMRSYLEAVTDGTEYVVDALDEKGYDVTYAVVGFRNSIERVLPPTNDIYGFKVYLERLWESKWGTDYWYYDPDNSLYYDYLEDIIFDEPDCGLDAIMGAIQGFDFRPGAQKIFFYASDSVVHYNGDGTGLSYLTMPEVATALQDAGIVLYACDQRYPYAYPDPWVEGTIIPADEDEPAVLALATGGQWNYLYSYIYGYSFAEFAEPIMDSLTAVYSLLYSTTDTRSDGESRDVETTITDPGTSELPGFTETVRGRYISDFIDTPKFDSNRVPFAVFGQPGYTTQNPDIALYGFCDTKATDMLVNGSDAGLTYTPGGSQWRYEGTLEEGANQLEIVSIDKFGHVYGPLVANYVYNPNPNLISIDITAQDTQLILYEKIRIDGTLNIPDASPESLSGRLIRIQYQHPDIGTIEQYTVTDSGLGLEEGAGFIDSLRADHLGVWTIRAKFDGDDDFKESGWSAPPVTVTVLRDMDVDKDGKINALDVQLTINSALGQNIAPLIADSNDDGLTDAVDIQHVINAALAL